ncbi:MAG TPA: succinate dehydrogenase/fumarate reductase iron-sulfur subunit [Gemmatimonadaceae bacterium]|nr:succinate dehydrogenase/fumarate reductase iron-sulfur subunit [Gemmatimonadaceae bacterium]
MRITLRVWRQKNRQAAGAMQSYQVDGVEPHMSFLEMLDLLNHQLITRGEDPVAFDSDCREGICGMCSLMINGEAHGPLAGTTACQLMMRHFRDGETITVEPWRAEPFPVVRDLVVDRRAFDRIMEAGGYVSIGTGSAPDASVIPVEKDAADVAFQAATCIGCGACVAACPNGSAMLFVAAKIAHLSRMPQGHPERIRRTVRMVEQMDLEGFGGCTNHYECAEACPKEIPVQFIAEMNREFLTAALTSREFKAVPPPIAAEE